MKGFLEENGIRAVCFDIDGTFYPLWKTNLRVAAASVPFLPFALRYNRARKEVRREDSTRDLPPSTREERAGRMCALMYGRSDRAVLERFLSKEERVFFRPYERLFSSIRASEGVKEVLERLEREGLKMAVLTDFPVGSKLRAMGIERYFSVVLSSEDVGRYKPSSAPFRVLLEAVGEDADRVLYVGDSVRKDIMGAKGVGMKSALINGKDASGIADLVAGNWKELYAMLFGIEGE